MPYYRCTKPLKPKQSEVHSDCRGEILKTVLNVQNKRGISRSESSLSQEDTIPARCSDLPTPPATKVKGSFMSFPSSPSNPVMSKPCVEIQTPSAHPTGDWIPASDGHRAGGLPSGSRAREVSHSCLSLVTSYPGGGSISMEKQQIPRPGLMVSKFFRNCVIFPKRANSSEVSNG